jgi:hypothetical protein
VYVRVRVRACGVCVRAYACARVRARACARVRAHAKLYDIKVKKFTLQQATKAQRESRGIDILFL